MKPDVTTARAGLGLDAGGGATRWVLAAADGTVRARGEGPPLTGHVFSDAARARAQATVAALAGMVRAHGTPGTVVAGITGTGAGSPEAAFLAALLAASFGLPARHVQVADDLWIAHRACFPPGRGILVYSGTGSAAVHVAADGTMLRAGGMGHLIDDGGSGFAIGRDALRAVLRAEETAPGSGWGTPLGHALAARIGGTEWDRVRAHVYGGDRATMAALVPAVAEAARTGDRAATHALRRAGAELARLAAVLRRRAGTQEVALAGGAARAHPLVRQAMQAALGEAVGMAESDAAAAAARIAAEIGA